MQSLWTNGAKRSGESDDKDSIQDETRSGVARWRCEFLGSAFKGQAFDPRRRSDDEGSSINLHHWITVVPARRTGGMVYSEEEFAELGILATTLARWRRTEFQTTLQNVIVEDPRTQVRSAPIWRSPRTYQRIVTRIFEMTFQLKPLSTFQPTCALTWSSETCFKLGSTLICTS